MGVEKQSGKYTHKGERQQKQRSRGRMLAKRGGTTGVCRGLNRGGQVATASRKGKKSLGGENHQDQGRGYRKKLGRWKKSFEKDKTGVKTDPKKGQASWVGGENGRRGRGAKTGVGKERFRG